MSGDSFCKISTSFASNRRYESFNPHVWGLFLQEEYDRYGKRLHSIVFQSPCLGTLFASQEWIIRDYDEVKSTFNPHVWGLFLQVLICATMSGKHQVFFQSPCLGTLFASSILAIGVSEENITFNPHVWGLFLQEDYLKWVEGMRKASFNPHVWGLFLQESYC